MRLGQGALQDLIRRRDCLARDDPGLDTAAAQSEGAAEPKKPIRQGCDRHVQCRGDHPRIKLKLELARSQSSRCNGPAEKGRFAFHPVRQSGRAAHKLGGSVRLRLCEKRMAFCCRLKMPDDDPTERGFQRLGGQTPAGGIPASCDQAFRYIIGKAPTGFPCVGRGQVIAGLVAEPSSQDPRIGGRMTSPTRARGGGDEFVLNLLPECVLDDRWMLAGIGLVLVADVADVDRVGQKIVRLCQKNTT